MSHTLAMRAALGPSHQPQWLFGRNIDLAAFGGSLLFAALLVLGAQFGGYLNADTPTWPWLLLVLGVDVGHVWSTIFRVYLVPGEIRRRPLLYIATPILMYAVGLLLYGFSAMLFWRAVAYFAVFHFVRQQIGWMRLYHRREPLLTRSDRALDMVALSLSMLYPLAVWHTTLPRHFSWMIDGDFVRGLPRATSSGVGLVYLVALLAWSARWIFLAVNRRVVGSGRLLLLTTTGLSWYLGIVAFNSDLAFTAFNVVLHGVPYFVLTLRYGRARGRDSFVATPLLARLASLTWPRFTALAIVVLLGVAFLEELLWDRLVWHDHPALFGATPWLTDAALVVPLLAVPQLTHYVLDGFIWRKQR